MYIKNSNIKHLKTYKIFEDSSGKLIDKYYKEADEIRAKFTADITVIENKFIDDVRDCMYDLTDHSEWSVKEENDGPFYRYYIFKVTRSKSWTDDAISFDEFVKAMNDSVTKLENYLGVKYEITYINYAHKVGDLSNFNKTVKWYKEQFKRSREPIGFKIYIGDTSDGGNVNR